MKKLIACVAAAASLSCFAEGVPVLGAGAMSCGTFVKYKEDKTASGIHNMVGWTLGYLSAVNVTRYQEGKSMLRSFDLYAVEAYLEKDCKEHPLDMVYQAVMRMSIDLGNY